MRAPQQQRNSRLLSWLGQLWNARRPVRRLHTPPKRTQLVLELLEDRLTPTTLTDQAGTLTILLDSPGDTFTMKATGTNQYALTSSSPAAANDLFAAGLTGASLVGGTLSLSSDTSITIADLATGPAIGASVAFNDSLSNSYAVPITVSLMQPLSGGVTFSGASSFAAGLTVTTTHGDIVSTGGTTSVTGDLSLSATTNIALAGSLAVTGATTLAAGGTIAASSTSNTFTGGVSAIGANGGEALSASVAASGALTLNEVQVSGNLTVTAGGAITQGVSPSGTNTVGGSASFTASSGDIVLTASGNVFSGDITVPVQGTGNIQISNTATTTTLGTIMLGTGSLTINDQDSSGTTAITEDGAAGGIKTMATSAGIVTLNIATDGHANIDLSAAPNDLVSGVTIAINGTFGGSVGNFFLQNVDASASAGQLSAITNFTVNSLSLDFPNAANGINTDSLKLAFPTGLAFAGDLTLVANGPISDGANALNVLGAATFKSTTGSVTIANTAGSFSGTLSAAVTGTNSIQLDNSNATTTLGTITLGSGNLTINDDDLSGISTITETSGGHGISTATSPTGTPQIAVNISSDSTANVRLDTAANSIASGYAVNINGVNTTGSTGDLGYRSTSVGANIGQIHLNTTTNPFAIANLTLEFDDPGANLDIATILTSLPATGNVSVTAGGNVAVSTAAVTLTGNLAAKAIGGSISIGAALTVGGTLTMTAGGSISQTAAGTITAGAATFAVTGAASSISLSTASPPNSVTGAVAFNTPAAGTGSVTFTNGGAIVLGSSSLGNGTFTITADGSGGITEQPGATIAQGKNAGQASFTAGPTGTTIDLSTGSRNFFTGPVTFNGPLVTSIGLEDANPLATLGSVVLGGSINQATLALTLIFDGAVASLELPAATSIPYILHLSEQNNIVLPATATLTVTNTNNLTLESLAGNIDLFGTLTVPGLLTLKADPHFTGTANILATNPANAIGTLAINNAAAGTNTVVVAGTLTLGSSAITAGTGGTTGTLTVTALTGSIQETASASLNIAVPATFNAPGTMASPGGDINLGVATATNVFGATISANVTNPQSTQPNSHFITIANSATTTTLGTIILGTGTLTVNDTFAGTGSTIAEDGTTAGIFTQGAVVINISTDTAANVDLSGAPNAIGAIPNVGSPSVTINGPAPAIATGNFGLRNVAPAANSVPINLGSNFKINNLTLEYDFTSIDFGTGKISTLVPSGAGNITLIAGGGITQAAPIVTSGSAVFTISGFVGDAGINLNVLGIVNQMATGAGATIRLNDPLADNQQKVLLANNGNINLGASTLGLSTLSLTASGNIVSTAPVTQQPGGGAVNLTAGGNTISLTASEFFSQGNAIYGPVTYTGNGVGGLTVIGFENNNPLATLPTITGAAPNLTSVSYELRNAPIALGNLSTATLTATAGGNIVQQNGTHVNVSGEAFFNAGPFGIQLTSPGIGNPGNNIAEIALSNSGLNGVTLNNAGPIVLDALAVGAGPLTINARGAITETASAGLVQTLGVNDSVAGTVTLNAPNNPILLDNALNQFLGPVSAAGSVLTVQSNSRVILGNVNVAGGLTVVSPAGTITQAPGTTVQVGGSAFLSSGGAIAAITLTNPGNTIAGAASINSPGGSAAVTVNGPIALASVAVGGQLAITAASPGNATPVPNINELMQPGDGINAMSATFTSAGGNITLQGTNNFNDQVLSLSAPTGAISVTDGNPSGVALGAVSFGNSGMTLTASGAVTQVAGTIAGPGNLTISAASSDPTQAIAVAMTPPLQGTNNSLGGAIALSNVSNVTISNAGSIALTGTSTIATSAPVNLTAGGAITLPNGSGGTLTLGSLTASANVINLGNLGVNLTTTAGGIQLTGNVAFQQGVTIDTSAGGNIMLAGNVTDIVNGQPLTFNLPSNGKLELASGTWNQGSNNLTVTGANATVAVDSGATLAMSGGTLTITGSPTGGGSPSTGNNLDIAGTLQVGGNVTVSDGGANGTDSIVTMNVTGAVSFLLGPTDGALTFSGANASDQLDLASSAQLTGFGGAASNGTIINVSGAGSLSGTFANAPSGQNFLMGTDIVSAGYSTTSVSIVQTPAGASVPIGAEPDGDLYSVSVTGGTGLVVVPVTMGGTPGLAIVVRIATAATKLTVSTTPNGGDGFTSVAGIAIDGPGPATIAAPTTNVTGNITIGGPLAALTLNNLTGGTLTAGPSVGTPVVTSSITANVLSSATITLQTALATLTANAVTGISGDFGLGTITAPSFGTITVGAKSPGSFFTNLRTNGTATQALTTATISGTVGGNWDLNGSVGTVTAGAAASWSLGLPNGPGVVNGGKLTNVTSLTLGTATDLGIFATGTVGAIKATSIDDTQAASANASTNATLEALAFGTITTTGATGATGAKNADNGNFLANLTATGSAPKTGALGSLTVAGNLGSSAQPFALLFANGNVGAIAVGDLVQGVFIDAATTATGGAIGTLSAGGWTNTNLAAAAVGSWKVGGNVPSLLLGDFVNSVVTLTGIAGSSTPTLGSFSTTGVLNGNTFDILFGSVTTFMVGGAMDNSAVELQSSNGSLGTITAADWLADSITAASIGTLRSLGRPAVLGATPGLLGNILNSTIIAFAGGIGTFGAAGYVAGGATVPFVVHSIGGIGSGNGYLLANGTIGTFSVGRTVDTFQVATDLYGGTGAITSLTAGRWSNSDLATFALGSATIAGFASPDQLAGARAGDLVGSDIVVNGSSTIALVTSGIGKLSVANNLDNDFFNVPFGIVSLGVTGTIGATGPTTLALLNPLSATASTLGSLTAGAAQFMTLYANQAGSISITGSASVPTIAIGFGGTGAGAVGLATLAAGSLNGGSLNVKEGIGSFTVGQESDTTIAAAYDPATPAATIGTLSAGSWNATMAAGSIGTFTVTGNLTSSRITLLGAAKGVALGTFTAKGSVFQSEFQVTGGNVTSFTTAYFIDSGLFVGYRLVDLLNLNDPLNNQSQGISNWEASFTLGTFKTTAVLSTLGTATRAATAGFQTSTVVAAKLGTITLSGVNPTPNVPTSITVNGQTFTVPQAALAQAAFGVGFRSSVSTGATTCTIAGTTVHPSTSATLSPAFFYVGVGG